MEIMDKIVNPCVHLVLQTIIISMAVNNLQGEMILIYHTQEVSDGRTSEQDDSGRERNSRKHH